MWFLDSTIIKDTLELGLDAHMFITEPPIFISNSSCTIIMYKIIPLCINIMDHIYPLFTHIGLYSTKQLKWFFTDSHTEVPIFSSDVKPEQVI